MRGQFHILCAQHITLYIKYTNRILQNIRWFFFYTVPSVMSIFSIFLLKTTLVHWTSTAFSYLWVLFWHNFGDSIFFLSFFWDNHINLSSYYFHNCVSHFHSWLHYFWLCQFEYSIFFYIFFSLCGAFMIWATNN